MSHIQDVSDISTQMQTTTIRKPQRKSKATVFREESKFRHRKNADYQNALRESIMVRLKVKDPTNISQIKPMSTVVPTRVPVTLRGIPALLDEVWSRMEAIGTRPFAQLATPENKAIFFKVCLLIFEAKVCWAQRRTDNLRFDAPTRYAFTDIQLRAISAVSARLPFPIVIALEALGNFSIDNQPVVPVFAKTDVDRASGAINFALTNLRLLITTLRVDHQVDNVLYVIATELNCLPNIQWIMTPAADPAGRESARLNPATVAFWADEPLLPAGHREIFLKIMASLENKRGFLLQVDIEHGDGTAVPVIRFPDVYDKDENETMYYMNAKTSQYDEQLAPALMYGFEYRADKFSRFCGTYDEPLIHGSASQAEARYALVWADKE